MLEKDLHYAMVMSERTTGKTFFFHSLAIYNYCQNNKKTVYVKRVDRRVTKSDMEDMFNHVRGKIPKLSNGRFNDVFYRGKRFYLCKYEDNEMIEMEQEPFMIVLALNVQDDTKSVFNDNDVNMIWFEEFMTRERYLTDEFLKFQALISTVVRLRDDVIIVMTANTVNRFCPYFNEMGLYKVRDQKQGTIDIYEYGESGLRVGVEYTAEMVKNGKKKPSNVYFAFDNPRLEMVKSGSWEIASYPHIDFSTRFDDVIVDDIWVDMHNNLLQGDIRYNEGRCLLYAMFWKPSCSEIKLRDTTIIYTDDVPTNNHYRYYFDGDLGAIIINLLSRQKVFYSDNEAGEIMNNFLKNMNNSSIIRG